MRVLFDHNIPSGTARALAGHQATEAVERGWHRISKVSLSAMTEEAEVRRFLAADKRVRYQQNLKDRRVGVVVIGNPTWQRVLDFWFGL